MRVDNVGALHKRHFDEAAGEAMDNGPLAQQWEAGKHSLCSLAPIKLQPIDLLNSGYVFSGVVLGARHLSRFPAQGTLLVQDGARAKRIATLQWDRMIQNVHHMHQ
jgi:hypothetical protein